MTTDFHYTDNYLLNPIHPVTVNVIGCGGTGSHVLTGLARMNEALLALGHRGLFVTAFDPDAVSQANIGRQMFSHGDLGSNKAVTLITRINRHFGNEWRGIPEKFDTELIKRNHYQIPVANITFTCVDTIRARKEVKKTFNNSLRKKFVINYDHPHSKPFYWMDFGNTQKTGQIVLATIDKIIQPTAQSIESLPDIFTLFPTLKNQKEDFIAPSCSQRESLKKQDLFINSTLAQFGLNIFWEMFRDFRISHQGAFVNLKTLRTNPISLPKRSVVISPTERAEKSLPRAA